jgi:hypothetical protein
MDGNNISDIRARVLNTHGHVIKTVNDKREPLIQKMNQLRGQFNKHIRKSCEGAFAYFDNNGKISDLPSGLRFELNEGIDRAEAEKKIKELKECYNIHGKEMMSLSNEMKGSVNQLKEFFGECEKKCIDEDSNMLEPCLTACVKNTAYYMNRFYDSIDKKLNEINDKMII